MASFILGGGIAMWEIPFYVMIAPAATIIISLFFSLKQHKYFKAPIIIFISLTILTIIIPLLTNVGREGIFAWAIFYTIISLLISFFVWLMRKTFKRKFNNTII